MPATDSEAHADAPKDGFLYTAGPALASGAAQAVLFNPVDRALYVRVKFRRSRFLDWRNFERPFQGFMNAAVYRTLVGASYMFWQDSARIWIQRFLPQAFQAETSPQLNSFVIGLFAGAVNGLALNNLQAVKFRMWNTDDKGVTFVRTATHMFREGGLPIFFRGCVTTVIRDSIFGIVYETTRRARVWTDFFDWAVTAVIEHDWFPMHRQQVPPSDGQSDVSTVATPSMPHPAGYSECGLCAFVSNLIAAIIASAFSSPFNYVRSVVYGTPAGSIPLGYWALLTSFYTQFLYIWRNGQSFTDLHGISNLPGVQPVPSPSAAVKEALGNGVRRSPAAAAAAQAASQSKGRVSQAVLSANRWAMVNHQHPFAAWKWANSRLNIGWGSVRVGLGMALTQSLFHMTQDYARNLRSETHS